MSLESVTPTPLAPGMGPSQVQVSVCVGGCCLCVPFSLVSGPLLCPTPHEPLGGPGGEGPRLPLSTAVTDPEASALAAMITIGA